MKPKRILLIIHPIYEEWSKEKTIKTNHRIIIEYVSKRAELKEVSRKYKNDFFDCVVLASSHGHHSAFQIAWDPEAGIKMYYCTWTAIEWFTKLTIHIHLCTCYQGRFLHNIMVRKKPNIRLSGYTVDIGGIPKLEKYQMLYIQKGCKSRHPDCKKRGAFVYYSPNKSKKVLKAKRDS